MTNPVYLSKRCECGYRRRSPGHDEGFHHKHLAIKVHCYGSSGGKAESTEMQRGSAGHPK